MAEVDKEIVVDAPVSTVYNQWTQFESFPKFMEGIESVTQHDAKSMHWVAKIAGKTKEWDAEVVEQVPDQVISWKNTTGTVNSGIVRFVPEGTSTRVSLHIEHDPEGVIENVGDALGVVGHRVEGDLKRFKAFVEERGVEEGGWRGTVADGKVAGSEADLSGSSVQGGVGSGVTGSETL